MHWLSHLMRLAKKSAVANWPIKSGIGGMRHSEIICVLGAADGLNEALRQHADFCLSLGKLTWPHLLARALLVEQLYRTISHFERTPLSSRLMTKTRFSFLAICAALLWPGPPLAQDYPCKRNSSAFRMRLKPAKPNRRPYKPRLKG